MHDRISRLAIFADLSPARIAELAAVAGDRTAVAGEVLVERGHPSSGMFVLEEGRAVVELGERTVDLGPGDVFGEMAIVGLTTGRSARVRAVTDARCLSFARADLERVLDGEPQLAARLRSLAEVRLAATSGE